MRLAALLVPALTITATLLSPLTADACWDGVWIESERVSLMIVENEDGDLEWPDAGLHESADWVLALEALLPPGETLSVEFGIAYFSDGSICTGILDVNSFAQLFTEVVAACGRTPAEATTALALAPTLYTVQLLSTDDRAAADARAEQLNGNCQWHGFYERGGFPSFNACAEVEPATLADGREVYRVIVGTFLSRASAEQAEADLRGELGQAGMVRRA